MNFININFVDEQMIRIREKVSQYTSLSDVYQCIIPFREMHIKASYYFKECVLRITQSLNAYHAVKIWLRIRKNVFGSFLIANWVLLAFVMYNSLRVCLCTFLFHFSFLVFIILQKKLIIFRIYNLLKFKLMAVGI